MKILIAIITCHKFLWRADYQRQTWLKDCKHDYKFFVGNGESPDLSQDMVNLDVGDDYKSLPHKVQGAMRWAREHGYDAVLKIDDDVYLLPDRIGSPIGSYVGRKNTSYKIECPKGWCSGFAYWLVGSALEAVCNEEVIQDTREDFWVGKILSRHKIDCTNHFGMVILSMLPRGTWSHHVNHMVAACEFPGPKMLELHDLIQHPEKLLVYQRPKGYKFGRVIRRHR